MCIIVDANRIGGLLGDPPDGDSAPVRGWIESGRGRIVYSTGGQFANEIGDKAKVKFLEYVRAGNAKLVPHRDFAEIEKRLRSDRRLRSNDPHIIALARASGARLLFSGDRNLIQDFTSSQICGIVSILALAIFLSCHGSSIWMRRNLFSRILCCLNWLRSVSVFSTELPINRASFFVESLRSVHCAPRPVKV